MTVRKWQLLKTFQQLALFSSWPWLSPPPSSCFLQPSFAAGWLRDFHPRSATEGRQTPGGWAAHPAAKTFIYIKLWPQCLQNNKKNTYKKQSSMSIGKKLQKKRSSKSSISLLILFSMNQEYPQNNIPTKSQKILKTFQRIYNHMQSNMQTKETNKQRKWSSKWSISIHFNHPNHSKQASIIQPFDVKRPPKPRPLAAGGSRRPLGAVPRTPPRTNLGIGWFFRTIFGGQNMGKDGKLQVKTQVLKGRQNMVISNINNIL